MVKGRITAMTLLFAIAVVITGVAFAVILVPLLIVVGITWQETPQTADETPESARAATRGYLGLWIGAFLVLLAIMATLLYIEQGRVPFAHWTELSATKQRKYTAYDLASRQ